MSGLLKKAAETPLWRDMTGRGIYVAATSCIGASVYGYDVSWWSSVLGMPYFREKFGIFDAKSKKYVISAPLASAGSAIPTAGLVIGALLCHFFSDNFGRKKAILAVSVMYIIAIIVELSTSSFWGIVIGRFLNSIPQGLSAVLLPAYQAECAPASCRGALVGIYTWFLDAGAVTAVGIVYNTYARNDSGSYKIVMGVQMIYPLLMLATLPWLPESPRYLMMKGKEDEANAVLRSLRVDPDDAEKESTSIRFTMHEHKESSWLELFHGPNLRRTLITCFIAIVETWQGLSFIGNYLVVFMESIGGGTINVYQLIVLINACLLITLTFFFWAPDYFGRRTLLLTGSAVMFTSFYIMAGVGGKDVSSISTTRQQVCVGMLFIWAIIYSSTWANLTWVTIGEMPTTRLRAKTAGLAFGLQSTSTIIITLFSPYVQSTKYTDWGAYIGFFFGSFSLLAFLFIFFFYPEVKGLSMEQMDVLFQDSASLQAFASAPRGTVALEGQEQDYTMEEVSVSPKHG